MQKGNKNNRNGEKSFPDFHIEIDKQNRMISVSVSAVSSVLDVGENAVLLKLQGRKIKVYGEELRIAVYENRIAEISGKVQGIELL